MPEFGEPSPVFVEKVRTICLALPETYEEPAWVGTRWRVRKRTIAHVFDFDGGRGLTPAVMFRSTGPELEMLRATGHPFVTGWKDAAMLFLGEETDWAEVAELVTESYCFLAPKKLAALVHRPDADRAD
jgi:hypothetical protein